MRRKKTLISSVRHLPFDSLSHEALEYMQNAFNLEYTNPANHLFVRERGWNGIINDKEMNEALDPNINSKEVKFGILGTINDLTVVTDYYDQEREDYDFDVQLYNTQTAINFKLREPQMTFRPQATIDVIVLDERINEWGMPKYARQGDAGMDLYACIDEPVVLKEGENQLIPTGIKIHINDPNIVAVLVPRSGLGHKKGIVLGNLVGIIDANYQGQVFASIWNRKAVDYDKNGVYHITVGDDDYRPTTDDLERVRDLFVAAEVKQEFVVTCQAVKVNRTCQPIADNSVIIKPGDKICQILFLPVVQATWNVVESFETSERGEGGFGHTSQSE